MDIFPQLVINSIVAGAVYALVAIGFNLIYGATKFFNLAHGAMAVIAGYIVFFLTQSLNLSAWLSIVIGIVSAGFIGFLLDKILYLPLRKKKSSNMVLLVASLGAFTVIQAILAIAFGSQFQTLSENLGSPEVYKILGAAITQTQVLILIAGIVIIIALAILLKKTIFGKAIKAISDDEEVSKIVGINTNKMIGYIFFIGSAIAGLAGIAQGFDTGIEPSMGLALLLKGVIAAIIGGVGNIYGAFIGAFLLGFVENFGIWKIAAEWKDAIAFVLLIVFLIFRPRGIMNK